MSRHQTTVRPPETDAKARRLIPAPLLDALIARSRHWTIGDVKEIVAAWKMTNYWVTHGKGRMSIHEVLRKWTDNSSALAIEVAWNSGPRGRDRVFSHLAHWLLDNMMWEVRLKCELDAWVEEKLSELQRIAGMEIDYARYYE